MSVQLQMGLRARKLGLLMRDARLRARKTISECAQAMGVKTGIYRAYEEGRRAPSLPEVEIFAYFLDLPVNHFWSRETISDDASPTEALNLPALVGVRQRMVGARLRQQRLDASISLKALAEQTGISARRLKAYELGERPVPLPELEVLVAAMGGRVENMFDQTGPVGEWISEERAVQDFLKLPKELREFVCKPVNRPYLELALRLSSMSTEKLRSVAEGLLDITL